MASFLSRWESTRGVSSKHTGLEFGLRRLFEISANVNKWELLEFGDFFLTLAFDQ